MKTALTTAPDPAPFFGHQPADLDAYFHDQMTRIVHRPVRLRAMDRAIIARDEVRWRRRALGTEPYLFGAETRAAECDLAGAVAEWRAAIRAMMMAKRGRV